MTTLYLATGNAHKVDEMAVIFRDLGLPVAVSSAQPLGGMPEVVEDGATFTANAALKARALANLAPPGSWVLADDSGLCVDALDGAPGIYSARYAGSDADAAANNAKLLTALADVPAGQRGAAFVCALALIEVTTGILHTFEGRCGGHITTALSGEEGFGYDPLFIPTGENLSFAAMDPAEKHNRSHRGQALAALAAFWPEALAAQKMNRRPEQ